MAKKSVEGNIPLSRLVDYRQIAEMMNVKVETARYYKVYDEAFPHPVTREGSRSPMFDVLEIEQYIAVRGIRSRAGGRPPFVVRDGAEALNKSAAAGLLVRDAVAASSTVSSMTDLAGRIGLSSRALGARIHGRVRWHRTELAAIAKVLGMDEADLLVASESE